MQPRLRRALARRLPRTILCLASAASLAACQTAGEPAPADAARQTPASGVEAVMRPVNGSAAQGSAKFVERGDGVAALVVLNNLVPGVYRVAIHENANCTSPNGYSAGRPWAPQASGRPAGELMPPFSIAENGNGQISMSVRGLRIRGPDSLEGRSVVVHAGPVVDADVVPDRPNRRILCGVVGPVRSFLDFFR